MSSATTPEATSAAPERPTSADPSDVLAQLRAENERLREQLRMQEAEPSREPRGRMGRTRGVASVVLVILTSIALVATTVGIWINRTVWNTDRYVSIVAPIADDPEVTSALSTKLSADVFEALDIQGRVEDALASIPNLPPSAAFLAGPITAGAQDAIRLQVNAFLASGAFQDLWVQLNRSLHAKVVALLNGDYEQLPNVSIEGGQVRLNLVSAVAAVIRQVAQRGVDRLDLDVTVPEIPADLDASAATARLTSALGVTLPADFGQVTIMSEAQLKDYQQATRNLHVLAGVLAILLVVLVALTLLVANDRRRALVWLGIGGAAALLLGGAFIRRMEARIVDSIQGAGAQAAARDVFEQVSASLRHAGVVVGVVALLVALIAYLSGRPRWFVAAVATARRATAPREGGSELDVWVAGRADAVRIASLIVAVVILFVTGIDWIPVAIVGGLLALALWRIEIAERRVTSEVRIVPDAGDDGTTSPAEHAEQETTDARSSASAR